MSTSSKYIIYQCNICQRETEILLDARRPDPVRCNITLKCRGKLQKTGERSSKGFLFTPIVQGLEDYVPRGTNITAIPTPKVQNPITIFSGSEGGMLAAAVVRRDLATGGSNNIFYVTDSNNQKFILEQNSSLLPQSAKMILSVFEVTPSLLAYKKYTFTSVKQGTQTVKGIDDSQAGRNLRFTDNDQVVVYLNGILLFEDRAGSIPDPNNIRFIRTIDNQITFSPSITDDNSIVEVIVYDDLAVTVPDDELIQLEFLPLQLNQLDLRDVNCWGDFGAVTVEDIHRSILYCVDLSELDTTKSYGVAKAEMISNLFERRTILSSEVYILLGKEPFLFQDKELHAFVNGSKLISPSTTLNYRQSIGTGAFELVIDSALVQQVYIPMVPSIPASGAKSASDVTNAVQTTNGTEDLKRMYILGPS